MEDKDTAATHRDPLPESFDSLDQVGAFWDTHSSADYEDLMEDVGIEVDLCSSKIYCPIEKDLARRLREQAQRQGMSTEELINGWLREKIAAA